MPRLLPCNVFCGLSVIFQILNFLTKIFSQKFWILALERANKGFGGRRHPAAAYPFEAVLRPGDGFKESRSKRWVLSFSLAAIPLLIFRPTRPLVAVLVFTYSCSLVVALGAIPPMSSETSVSSSYRNLSEFVFAEHVNAPVTSYAEL